MALRPYDPVGAMGGLFAPALIRGNRESEIAFDEWMARNLKRPPAPDAPPAPPAPTMAGPAPESEEEAAARQRDAIARTIMMLQGGDQGSGGVDTTAPDAPNLADEGAGIGGGPGPFSGAPWQGGQPPAPDRDVTPVTAQLSTPISTPVTTTPTAPPTDNRGVTVSHREGDPEIDPDAPPATSAPPAAPPAPAPVAAPAPPAAPQDPNAPETTPVPGMPMNPDIVPVSPLVENVFGPVPGPNSPVPATPLSTLSPHVGPPPPAMDTLNTLTTPWGRGNPWGLEHTPQQAPPNPFTPVNTMMETIFGSPAPPSPNNPFGENPFGTVDTTSPYGGGFGMGTGAGIGAPGGIGDGGGIGGGFGPSGMGDNGMGYGGGGLGGYGGEGGFGPAADAAAAGATAGTATGYEGGTIGGFGPSDSGSQTGGGYGGGGLGGYGGSGFGGNAGDAGLAGGMGGLDAAAAAAIGDAYGGGYGDAPSGPSDVALGGDAW